MTETVIKTESEKVRKKEYIDRSPILCDVIKEWKKIPSKFLL